MVITASLLLTGCLPAIGTFKPEKFSREYLQVEIINATETSNGVFYKKIEFVLKEYIEGRFSLVLD